MLQDLTRRPPRYRTFLLSLWEEAGKEPAWRCRLEDPRSGRQIGFHSPDELVRFLRNAPKERPMFPEQPPSAVLLAPGGGQVFDALGVSLTVKTGGAGSGGLWFVLEYTAPPRFSGPPPHYHKVMTEIFYVLEGALTLRVGDQTLEVGPGGYAYVPPGTVHGFSNPTDAPARFLGIASPALLEQYLDAMLELVKDAPEWPPKDMSQVVALMAKYDTFQPASQS
jgi:mannose-6-phosphate isomerase-like protein (cupin superfamily)